MSFGGRGCTHGSTGRIAVKRRAWGASAARDRRGEVVEHPVRADLVVARPPDPEQTRSPGPPHAASRVGRTRGWPANGEHRIAREHDEPRWRRMARPSRARHRSSSAPPIREAGMGCLERVPRRVRDGGGTPMRARPRTDRYPRSSASRPSSHLVPVWRVAGAGHLDRSRRSRGRSPEGRVTDAPTSGPQHPGTRAIGTPRGCAGGRSVGTRFRPSTSARTSSVPATLQLRA
jgi:hypothetical protein